VTFPGFLVILIDIKIKINKVNMLVKLRKGNVLISKVNSVGYVNKNTPTNVGKSRDKISGKLEPKGVCDETNDPVTTYVMKKEWVIALQNYIYIPYVECDYVI